MVAALGAVLTGIAAAAPEGPPTVEVVRAKRQLAGGAVISPDDVTVERVVAADAPEGAVSDPGALVGQTLAAPIARRQVLTSLALISTRGRRRSRTRAGSAPPRRRRARHPPAPR